MTSTRRVLLGLVTLVAVLTAAILWEVLGTVFFAITLVYVAAPLYDVLVERGLAPRWASAVSTAAVFLGTVALFVPFAVLLYLRRGAAVALLRSLPDSAVLAVGGFEYEIVTVELVDATVVLLQDVAFAIARGAPVIAVKLTVLGMVLFALLVRRESVGRAVMAGVPWQHRHVVVRLSERARETMLAIYILQVVTALGTFVVAYPLFALLGYEFAFMFALLAGLLQFMPVVGPTLLLAALVAAEVVAGDLVGAVLVGVLGWIAVGALPDIVLRPWLAERTAKVPGSLYFIGFTGGLLTVGPIGIIAGPLVVVLLHETLRLLADETDVAPHGTLVDREP